MPHPRNRSGQCSGHAGGFRAWALWGVIFTLMLAGIAACADSFSVAEDDVGGWTLYDNFSSGSISSSKWTLDQTNPGDDVSVQSGELRTILTANGSQATFVSRLKFTDPDSINGIRSDVRVTAYTQNAGVVRSRLSGTFYNDGTAGATAGSFIGDIFAAYIVVDTSLSYFVLRMTDVSGTTFDTLQGGTVIDTISLGTTAQISLVWDGVDTFSFERDGTVLATFDPVTAGAPVAQSSANFPLKYIGSTGNFLGANPDGNVTGYFDNVYTQ